MKKFTAIVVILVAIMATITCAMAQSVRFTPKVSLALTNSARYFGSEVDEYNYLVNTDIPLADKKVTRVKKSYMSDASRYALKDTMVSIRDFSDNGKRTTLNVKSVDVWDQATLSAFMGPEGIFDVQRLLDACSRNGAEYGYEGRAWYACCKKDVGVVAADVKISGVTLTIHRVQQYWTVVNGVQVQLASPVDAWAIEMVKGQGKPASNGGNNGGNTPDPGKPDPDDPANEPDPRLDPVVDPTWDTTPVDAHPSTPSTPSTPAQNEPNPQLDVVVDPGWVDTFSSSTSSSSSTSGSFGSSGQTRPSSSSSSGVPAPALSEVVDPW